MGEPLAWALAGLAGVALGAFFFGGLWLTVRAAAASKRTALWFAGSLLVRTAVVCGGFFVVSGGRLGCLLACLLGFVLARAAAVRLTGPAAAAHRKV